MAPFVKRTMLTADEKKEIIKLHEDSIKQTEIARLFSVNSSTVCGIIRRYELWGDIENQPGSGRPSLLSDKAQHALITKLEKNRGLWGCITFNGVGILAFVDGSIDPNKYIDILENNLWPVITRHFPAINYIFQDDNAPVHRARTIVEYKLRNKTRT